LSVYHFDEELKVLNQSNHMKVMS